MMDQRFGDEELRTLAFDMGADYESLPAVGKAGKVRELVVWAERRRRLGQLAQRCYELRPEVMGWPVFHDDAITTQRELSDEIKKTQ